MHRGKTTAWAAGAPRGQEEVVRRLLWGAEGAPHVETLTNGLELCVLEEARLPIVSTVLAYRVGARDESEIESGAAHFLEHMMFKGSERFGPGEIDRITEARGGSNNAFTSHDVTAYYFSFASEHWATALEIESDRLGGLLLEPDEVDSERQVILEELAMYESDPWDVLHQEASRLLYPQHPYGRPVLGTRDSLAGLGSEELRAFHRRHYRTDNAVLVVAGDVERSEVRRLAEALPKKGLGEARAPLSTTSGLESGARFAREFGEVSRLLVSFPAPPAGESAHALARLLAVCLAGGRSSRLNRTLVEEEELALWVAADVTEMAGPASLSLALEVTPGVDEAHVGKRLFEELESLRTEGLSDEELERAQKMTFSDWSFAHERLQRRALTAALALCTFDPDHPVRSLGAALTATSTESNDLARQLFDPRLAVVSWSRAEAGSPDGDR